jgi:hypothetical protein
MKSFVWTIFLLLFFACKKEELAGPVTINGKVKDIVSDAPLSNTPVKLLSVRQVQGIFGYQRNPEVIMTTTTDAAGNYTFSTTAKGETGFDVIAEPNSPLYASSVFTIGQDYHVTSTGTTTRDLKCHRSAFAKVNLINVPPVDTPYFIALTSPASNVVLNNLYRDTVVYLKLVARPEIPNDLRFNKSNVQNEYPKITAGPWDTIRLDFRY